MLFLRLDETVVAVAPLVEQIKLLGVGIAEQEEIVVTPGMIVLVPAGEKHWHGATEDTPFTQLSLYHPGKTQILK